MRFYKRQHRHYCGIDLHVKTMYVCILDAVGHVLVHRNVKSSPDAFLETIAPYRDDLVVAAECMFTWYWLGDVCTAEGITFVLGHALAMKAVHGGKVKNDKLDSHKIAVLLRGGLLPPAYVYPAAMRSTRDLIRRRLHLVRKRGQLLAHIQNTRAQYNLAAFERRLAYPANREGVAERFSDPSVRKSIEVDLALVETYDGLITDLELTMVREAKRHDADAFDRVRVRARHREDPGADDSLRNPGHHPVFATIFRLVHCGVSGLHEFGDRLARLRVPTIRRAAEARWCHDCGCAPTLRWAGQSPSLA